MKKSPFPGMDPYLERRWGDVHTALCIGIRASLQPNLPAGLRARAQTDVLLEEVDTESVGFQPDVSTVETDEVEDDDLEYSKPTGPPLSPEDAEWAAGLLSNRGGKS